MAMTPEDWLAFLGTSLDQRNAARVTALRQRLDGNAPLPEGAEGCRDAYRKFQAKARTNFGELAVEAVADRMINAGFEVGQGDETVEKQLMAIWRRNHLQIGAGDVHRDMLGIFVGYTMISPGPNGAIITVEKPEEVITEPDPLIPSVQRAGLKLYRDETQQIDVAYLHIPGEVYRYTRPCATYTAQQSVVQPSFVIQAGPGGWELDPEFPQSTGLSVVPIVPFLNRKAMGEFEPHVDVLDRINWNILQRLVIEAIQAFRQRAIKGDLPEKDEQGHVINYDEVFKPGAGALWLIPETAEIWESAMADVQGILAAAKDDIKEFAAVTRTPMSVMIPDSANQTAEGAAFAKEGLMFKSRDRVARAGVAWAQTMAIALAVEDGESVPRDDIETLWVPVEYASITERTAAAVAAKTAGVPWRTIMADYLLKTPDEITRMEAERAADALNEALAAPGPGAMNGNPQGNPAQGAASASNASAA